MDTNPQSIDPTSQVVSSQEEFDPHAPIWKALKEKISSPIRKRYLSKRVSKEVRDRSNRIQKLLLRAAAPGPFRSYLAAGKLARFDQQTMSIDTEYELQASRILHAQQNIRSAFKLFHMMFPSEIWHCCRSACFAAAVVTSSSNLTIIMKLKAIHETAKRLHDEI